MIKMICRTMVQCYDIMEIICTRWGRAAWRGRGRGLEPRRLQAAPLDCGEHANSVFAGLGRETRKVSRNRSRTQVLLQARRLHVYGHGTFGAFWPSEPAGVLPARGRAAKCVLRRPPPGHEHHRTAPTLDATTTWDDDMGCKRCHRFTSRSLPPSLPRVRARSNMHVHVDVGTYAEIRPVHLLGVSLLRVLESNFPGDPL